MKPRDRGKEVTSKQCVETGMLLVLGALLIAIHLQQMLWVKVAVVLLLIAMTAPGLYYPFAFIWFKLVRITGVIGPALILTGVFLAVVTPMGWLRRRFGKDALRLRAFKKDNQSVMVTRNHQYGRNDFRTMF
ncbi:MAG TPA: hypothetical protein VK658_23555 [Chryseolinea sp.]|nr:hypothetical protein [Chryseolinea sp.]